MPTRLEPAEAPLDARPRELETLHVRIEPTASYTAQVVDYERRFRGLLEATNALLAPALGIRLELAGTRPFAAEGGEDHIGGLVDDLRRDDAGEDVDWVIGLAGSVPRFEDSFHELGMSTVVGKHVVLRALNDRAEYEAIQGGFTELSAAERDKLLDARLEHKAAVVLLHELGHTLGALHERDRTNIMNPRYSTSVRRFSPEALDVMRAVLAHRTASGDLDAPGKRTLVGLLRREPSPWVPEERASELARFDVHTPEAAPAARAPAPSALAPEDQSAFEEASRRLAAGDPEGALRVGKPLFDAYPDVAQVSELRCKIALGRGLAWEVTRTECASLTQGAFGTH